MRKCAVLTFLSIGLMASAAQAARLGMRWVNGSNGGVSPDGKEVTMAPSDTVTLEVYIQWQASDDPTGPGLSRLTGADNRFEVGQLANSGTGDFVDDQGTAKYSVTGVSTPLAGWITDATTGVGGPFNRGSFFLSALDPLGTGTTGGITPVTNPGEAVLARVDIHKDGPADTLDYYVVFRSGAALPALSRGGAAWTHNWQAGAPTTINTFVIGDGNPGDGNPADWAYHGYEIINPLVIHNIPEPGSLALIALGALMGLRRRS